MLGLDDKLIIALGFVALLVLSRIIFWLHKIYRRVRCISHDLGVLLEREEKSEETREENTKRRY